MVKTVTINREKIIRQIKLSYQIPSVIDDIVSQEIIEETAVNAGIHIEDHELQRAADQLRLYHKLQSADATWAWLQRQGLSEDDFEQSVYNKVVTMTLAAHLFADKVEPYFYEHRLDYAGAVMYEVVLEDPDLAMELYYSIEEGETSLHEIARQYIQDKELRRTGGYRGILRRKDLRPEVSAAVFAAKPPQLLKPVVTAKGVHLIYLEELIESRLDEKLRMQIMAELFNNWLKEQIKQVNVDLILDSETIK